MDFILFISWVVLVRLLELAWSSSNARWLLQQGAVEYGRSHYPFIVALHSSFLLAMIAEYLLCRPAPVLHWPWLLGFLILTLLKVLVIAQLGKYWNTRIYRVPGTLPVRSGIYKYIRHPNYMIVVLEFIAIPMTFHLYYTMAVYSLLNALMLWVRISAENKALRNN